MQCVASCTKYFKKQSLRTVNPYLQLMIENIIFFITDMTKSIDNVTETAMKKRLKMLAKQQSFEQRDVEVRGQRLSASECRRYSMLDANRPPSKSNDQLFSRPSHSSIFVRICF